jgi:hopene-associated glycosyltransferase HpnB
MPQNDYMVVAISLLSFLGWVYLIAFRGRFWRSIPVISVRRLSGRPRVSAVIPARNEATNIHVCLTSLLSQDYSGELSVILIDDNSTDATASISSSLAIDSRLTIVRGTPLPADWTGKLWAINQGLAQEKARGAEYILLTDADIDHAPGHVSALVAKAESDGLDLVSEMVRLNCSTVAEYTFIPAFVFFFQMLYPFLWVADPTKRVAGAAGGTILIRRVSLDRIGGVSRIRNRLIDDCALARQIKESGGTIWLGHSEMAVSRRVYSNVSGVWNMIARTAYEQLGHSPLMLLGCAVGMSIIFCAPVLITFCTHGLSRVLGVLSWLMMAAAFQPTLRRYGRSPLWGIALPLIGLFYLCSTLASAVRFHSGRGGGWKDRFYSERADN